MGISKIAPSKSLFFSDFKKWKTELEIFIANKDPDLLRLITAYPYKLPNGIMTSDEEKRYFNNQRAYEMITKCLPQDIIDCYQNQATAYDLWKALLKAFDKDKEIKLESSSKGVKKEEEENVLQSQALNMENERKEIHLKVARMENELQRQQKELIKLQEDHALALKTIEDLRGQLSQVSHSSIQSEKVVQPAKVVKKIYASKSSCGKKISQFTNYSLQKNKKYSKKLQSTPKKVDCLVSAKVSWVKRSVSRHDLKTKRASEPIQHSAEPRRTKSCAYTRAHMMALAPRRRGCVVLKHDFVPFSQRPNPSHSIPRQQFRYETSRFNFRWNSISLDYVDSTYRWLSRLSKPVGTMLRWVPKVVVA